MRGAPQDGAMREFVVVWGSSVLYTESPWVRTDDVS